MAIQIKLKNSVVQDSTPSTSDLPAVGEIALNANINSIGGFMRASDNSIVKIFGPGSLSTPTATTTVPGISELATNSETTTGTATNRVVTPAGLNAVTVAERTTSNTNYVAKAGSTLTGVLTMPNGSNSAPAINFGDSDSGIFGGTNTVSLAAGGTTRLTADTGVSVVGTLAVTGAITSTDDLTIPDKIIHSGDTNTAVRFPAADTVSVETGGSEAIRVDSSGRLLVGTSTTLAAFGSNSLLQVAGTTFNTSSCLIRRDSTNSSPPGLVFGKSRGSAGSNTVVQNNDMLGDIIFVGADGTDLASQAAIIRAEVDGTPGSNDMPGRLVFSTTADGAASPTARMTIKADGKIGIGESSPAANLHVREGDSGATPDSNRDTLFIENNGNSGLTIGTPNSNSGYLAFADPENDNAGQIIYRHASNSMSLFTAGAERLRIDSSGNIGIGTESSDELLHIKATAVNSRLLIENTNNTVAGIVLKNSVQQYAIQSNVNDIIIRDITDSATRVHLDTSGNVSVGGTSPSTQSAKFQTRGTSQNATRINMHHEGNSSTSISANSGLVFGSDTANGTTQRMVLDTSGRLHIGTATNRLGETLHVLGQGIITSSAEDTNMMLFGTFGTSTALVGAFNNIPVVFRQNNTERMRINSSGSLLVGTTSDSIFNDTDGGGFNLKAGGQLVLKKEATSAADPLVWLNDTGQTTNKFIVFAQDGSEKANIGLAGNDATITVAGSERMRIDASGNVGINQVPTRELSLHSPNNNNALIHFTNDDTGETAADGILVGLDGNENMVINNQETNKIIYFVNGGSERMRLDSSGNLGIGKTNPSRRLEVETTHASGGEIVSFQNNNADNFGGLVILGGQTDRECRLSSAFGNSFFTFYTQPAAGASLERMRITSTGLVGIGTTNPHRPIHQHVSTSGSNYHQFTNSTTGSGAGDGGIVGLDGNEDLILWHQESQNLRFGTSNTERMRVQSNGGISFNGDTAAANALDDYEEGTWTPEYNTGSSASAMFDSCSYSQTQGFYTKIGNRVMFEFRIQASNIVNSNTNSHVIITGLPFTSSTGTGSQGGAEFNYSQAMCATNNGYLPTMHIGANNTNISFFTCDGGVYVVGAGNNNFLHTLHIHGQYTTAS